MTLLTNQVKIHIPCKAKLTKIEDKFLLQIDNSPKGKDARENMSKVLDLLLPESEVLEIILTDSESTFNGDGACVFNFKFNTCDVLDVSIFNAYGGWATDNITLIIEGKFESFEV